MSRKGDRACRTVTHPVPLLILLLFHPLSFLVALQKPIMSSAPPLPPKDNYKQHRLTFSTSNIMNVRYTTRPPHFRSSSSPSLLTVDEGKTSSRRSPSTPEERAAREAARRERRERRELTKGQTKEATDKLGSRHADVIDTWDPTGLGSASEWHRVFYCLLVMC